ncbi:porin [Rhodobacter sp. NSM]|uniref:porin n=1 Tax=Rhodobacter sp. NSM TaxID=3457501 RepID=UPI003FCF74A7
MNNQALLISAAIAILPLSGAAQTVEGAVTLGYGMTDLSGTDADMNTLSLDGRFGLALDNGLRFGVDLSGATTDIEDVSEDVTQSFAGLYGGYGFQNGATLGLYGEQARIDLEDLGDATIRSYGLMAGYQSEGSQITGFYGESDTGDELPDGVDVTDFGATFRYSGLGGATVGASAQRTTISVDGLGDVDFDFIGLAGSYAVQPGWTLFGGISGASLDLIDADLTTLGIGVAYDLSDVMHTNASVSLEVARSELEIAGADGDATSLRLGLSIPLGARGFSVPMNSVADSVLNPRHSAITSADFSAF